MGFENSANRTKIAELLRFTSKSGDAQVVKEHVDRMQQGDVSSPALENVRKNGPEALHVVDPPDEFAVQQPKGFDGKRLEPTTKDRFDLGDGDEKRKVDELKKRFRSKDVYRGRKLITWFRR